MEIPGKNYSYRIAQVGTSPSTAWTFGTLFWVLSTYWYKKRFYAQNKDLLNLVLFSFGSCFSSMAYARFLFEKTNDSAAIENNMKERRHLRSLGQRI